MTTLVLGVHDMAYGAQFSSGGSRRSKSRAQSAYGKGKTTGDIAQILEAKYHIMQTFYDMNKTDIASALEKSMVGSIINMVNGQPAPVMADAQAMSDIETAFKQALSMRAFDGVIPGVPTQASLGGRSSRFKRPGAKRGARPSFINTGLYQSSFTAWTE